MRINVKDYLGAANLAVHNVGAGGVTVVGFTVADDIGSKRYYQTLSRCERKVGNIDLAESYTYMAQKQG